MEDSEFDSDDMSYSAVADMGSITVEEFKAGNKGKVRVGVFLTLSPLLAIILLALLTPDQQQEFAVIIFVFMFVCPLGLVLLVYAVIAPRMILKGFKILKEASQSTPVLTKGFALTKIDDVYVFVLKSDMLYFVAFRGIPSVTEIRKIGVPKHFAPWSDKIEVDMIELYLRKGIFTIPLSSSTFGTGEAVLYSIQYIPSRYNPVRPEFPRERIHTIVRNISDEVKRDSTPQ